MSIDGDVKALREQLASLRGLDPGAVDVAAEAVAFAAGLQRLALAMRRRDEARELARFARMMDDAAGRVLTTELTDQALRATAPARVADQLRHLLRARGLPRYLPWVDRLALRVFAAVGGVAPRLSVPLVLKRVEAEMRRFVLPGEPEALTAALAQRRRGGARLNLNQLGEAILGEDEAEARLGRYLQALARPDIEAVSVKISSIASQIDVLDPEGTLEVLGARLARLYDAAIAHPIARDGGPLRPKLVTLDMEEFRDLELTVALFRRTLERPPYRDLTAGIVLQAYLPDSHRVQRALDAWAAERVAAGGAPIRLRLVKGANLAMEQVEAALHGWPQAPFVDKAGTDRSFSRMVRWAITSERLGRVRIGVGSHNVFDLAHALVLRALARREEAVGVETLEGLAPGLRRAVQAVTGDVLVYSPVAPRDEMQSAIAYLIRRLDENTAPENFLRHSFDLRPGAAAWDALRARFEEAVAGVEDDDELPAPRRRQDRRRPPVEVGGHLPGAAPFANEPDTDWALAHHRAWITESLAARRDAGAVRVPLVIAGEVLEASPAGEGQGEDPSRPWVDLYRWVKADVALARRAVAAARAAFPGWAATPPPTRAGILQAAARGLRAARGALIAALVADAGKAVPEADAEVSEAVDFAEYYARAHAPWLTLPGAALTPRGVVLVVPPWNFPLAIPAGGVLAALMAGNAVILKPAPETVLVAWELCRLLWDAGVPREVLQLVACDNDPVGTALVTDPRVDAVILTGGTATARRFLAMRPELCLFAETGGKNATIVTQLADQDLAIKHAVHGAFSHAGQKCSATSLLICEGAVYDDRGFRRRLADAVASLRVGSAWELGARVTPLIRAPRGDLRWALTQLDPGERWLVPPRSNADNPRLWSPGVKLGVRPGSRSHVTELFGPVLAVMRADTLDHAIALANATPYGLTAGLQSLDVREHATWEARIDAGNLYINRPTTGAIVQRQPFGGRKASVWGPGAKAGGPGYVAQLMRSEEDVCARLAAEGEPDDAGAYARWFAGERDPARLLGQDNRLRYPPCHGVLIRVASGGLAPAARRALAAARVAGARVTLSAAPGALDLRDLGCDVTVEGAEVLAARLSRHAHERIRYVGGVEAVVRAAAHALGIYCEVAPVGWTPELELPRYLREQVVSADYHRFGNLGAREGEARAPVI